MQDTTEVIMEETMEYIADTTAASVDYAAATATKCDSGWFQMCADQFGVAFYFFIGFYVLVIALMLVSNWIIFEKAGRKGWESLIPIYGTVIFFKIIGKSLWNLLWILTFVGIIVLVIKVSSALAKSFGRSAGFAWGLALFPLIFQAILAFDKSIVYAGPNGANLPAAEAEDED